MLQAVDSDASTFSLSRFVASVRTITSVAGGVRRVDQLPDGRTNLIVRLIDGRTGDVTVAGPRTRAVFKTASGVARAVVLEFKPGWSASLFGAPANELTDRYVPLEDLWGRAGRDLRDEILATRSVTEIVDRLSRAITVRSRQTPEPASALLARRAVRLLEGGEIRVERVASLLGVTSRHLRRAFTESVGIGPKEFARTVRLQRAVRMAATAKDWVRIATEAGYYDQAHLIGDFRELLGLTPGAFLKRAESSAPAP